MGDVPPLPRSMIDWLRVFGSGAIMATLTIGTGERNFSLRLLALSLLIATIIRPELQAQHTTFFSNSGAQTSCSDRTFPVAGGLC